MVVSVAGWLGIEAAQVSEANFSLRTGERSCVSGFAICDTLAMRAETPATHMRCRWDVEGSDSERTLSLRLTVLRGPSENHRDGRVLR